MLRGQGLSECYEGRTMGARAQCHEGWSHVQCYEGWARARYYEGRSPGRRGPDRNASRAKPERDAVRASLPDGRGSRAMLRGPGLTVMLRRTVSPGRPTNGNDNRRQTKEDGRHTMTETGEKAGEMADIRARLTRSAGSKPSWRPGAALVGTALLMPVIPRRPVRS